MFELTIACEVRREGVGKGALARRVDDSRDESGNRCRRRLEIQTEDREPSFDKGTRGETVLTLAMAFADAKWSQLAPSSRAILADSLATVTAALVADEKSAPVGIGDLRTSLKFWAFNIPARKAGQPRERDAAAIDWVERHSVSVAKLNDPATIRSAFGAMTTRADGKPSAPNTAERKRFVFHQMLEYGVEIGWLTSNPIDKVKWNRPKTSGVMDKRVVANPELARKMLAGVAKHSSLGERLVAFFALLYFAALRPGEALALRLGDCVLPETGWGELHLARSNSQPGFAWTDDGEPAPSRSLKHRAHGEVRHVPACPELVSYLREHVERFGTGADGQLFVSPFAQTVPKSAYSRVWRETRRQVLSKEQAASPLAKRPYDLRHAAVSVWLAAGVPVTLVAEWAGHGRDPAPRLCLVPSGCGGRGAPAH